MNGLLSMPRRRVLGAAALAPWLLAPARAQSGAVRMQLDSPIDGPNAPLALAAARGYFRQEALAVTLEPGSDAAGAIARVAAGSHELGCADLAALMEFHADNAGLPGKPVAVMIVHSNTPAAVLALTRSGIRGPRDLQGRHLSAPQGDAARTAWPIFARINAIDGVAWSTLDEALAEATLLRGEIDAITGAAYTTLPSMQARGVADDELVVLPYLHYGVKHYGQAIIAGDEFMRRRPDALKGFLRAFSRGMRETVADPRAAVGLLRTPDAAFELRRLRLALDLSVLTADARSEGFGAITGPRLALMASQVSDASGTRERVNPNALWNGSFLPGVAERNLFAVARR